MASNSDRTRYLKRIGEKWYVNVRVPRTLEKQLGTSHIRRALGTGDLAQANRLKLRLVSEIKEQLNALGRQRAQGLPLQRGLTLADAAAMRRDIQDARRRGDENSAEAVEFLASDSAYKIADLHGDAAAHRFYRAATRTEASLADLCERWLGDKDDYKEVTRDAHREALRGLLAFLADEDASPLDVTRRIAAEYIDSTLKKSGLARETIRRKINSLSTFWAWIDSKGLAPPQGNPWLGHHLSKKAHAGSRPARRNFSDDELVTLLTGLGQKARSATVAALPDLTVLGMYTGARIEELCKLDAASVEPAAGGYVLRIKDAKTRAGTRPVGVVHPAARQVLQRRLRKAKAAGYLFPEFKPGGRDRKLSHEASKAFGRQRRGLGIADGPDFHSFRRQVATILEHANVQPLHMARFLGHETGSITTDVYSEGGAVKQSITTAGAIKYAHKVEAAALRLVKASARAPAP